MKITIGDYLLKRLKEIGIRHIIGVPGDFNLQFLEQLEHVEGIEFVGASNELNAAYAADGYARENKIAALLVTYGVGDLGAIAGVAGSASEHIPVIVISGVPPLFAKRNQFQVHHSLADGNMKNMANVYKEFTVEQTLITQQNAQEEIDRAIRKAMRYKRPVNLQLPSNISYFEIDIDDAPLAPLHHASDEQNLALAIDTIVKQFQKAKRPAVLIDQDVDRYEVTGVLQAFIDKTQTPYAQMSTGKAILNENQPLYMGVYRGAMSDEGVQEKIEGADFLLSVSPRFIEKNSGYYSQNLPEDHLVRMEKDYCFVGFECFEGVDIKDVLHGLLDKVEEIPQDTTEQEETKPDYAYQADGKLSHKNFWPQVQAFFSEGDLIYAETGSSSEAMSKIVLPADSKYVASAFWGAIGFTLPAVFGSMLANPYRRHILFIGDGSFQVTAQELSRILYREQNPIIFLINNDGYTIERYIMGMYKDYNEIPSWNYHKLPELLIANNKMKTFSVKTQGELAQALEEAENITHGILIEVHLGKTDAPESLEKNGPNIAKFNFGPRGPENEKP